MAEDTHGVTGRSADPAVDAVDHLAAAVGTHAWPVARAGAAALLGEADGSASGEAGGSAAERVQAWAAEAERLDGAARDDYLRDSVPAWQDELASALTLRPQRADQARQFADLMHTLLAPPGGTESADSTDSTDTEDEADTAVGARSADSPGATGSVAPQIATATGHGTVNAVQHGNIYHQVVFGRAERKRLSWGAAATVTAVAGTGAALAGTAAARHLTGEEADAAGAGDAPQGPLADPAAPADPTGSLGAPQSPPAPGGEGAFVAPGAGASAPGGGAAGSAAATKATTGVVGKAAAALGVGSGGVSLPALITLVVVVVVSVTTVSVVVNRGDARASCDFAVDGRSAPAALAEAARRTGLTSYRFTVVRGTHHVTGAADPRARSAWFTQRVGDGPAVAGTIERGKVTMPTGTAVPAGADTDLVRSDGAFTDAVDPTAAARMVRSVATAERDGCDFTGTLGAARGKGADRVRTAKLPPRVTGAGIQEDAAAVPALADEPQATASPAPSVSGAPSASAPAPSPSTSPPPSGRGSAPFTARIDSRGRLVRLAVEAAGQPGGRPAVSARYANFGLAVTPSVPPTPSDGARSSAPSSEIAARLDGGWRGTWSVSFVSGSFEARLNVEGERITGRLAVFGTGCDLSGALTGTLKGDRITFGTAGGATSISFTGRVAGDAMKGDFSTACRGAKGTWSATHD